MSCISSGACLPAAIASSSAVAKEPSCRLRLNPGGQIDPNCDFVKTRSAHWWRLHSSIRSATLVSPCSSPDMRVVLSTWTPQLSLSNHAILHHLPMVTMYSIQSCLKMLASNPTFAHAELTHPNNITCHQRMNEDTGYTQLWFLGIRVLI